MNASIVLVHGGGFDGRCWDLLAPQLTEPALAIDRLGDRVRHAVFVGATVPDHGQAIIDTLDPAIQDMIRSAGKDVEPAPMDPDMAKIVLGDDLSPDQVAWCVERCQVIDIDASHMCMVSQPAETAAVITRAAAT